jgi:hypothetical protein
MFGGTTKILIFLFHESHKFSEILEKLFRGQVSPPGGTVKYQGEVGQSVKMTGFYSTLFTSFQVP